MDETLQIEDLAQAGSIQSMFSGLHAEVLALLPGVARIAFALYDEKGGELKTLVFSAAGGGNPLPRYVARLSDVPSLADLAARRSYRVIDDLPALPGSSEHTRKICGAGYRSSYTKPIFRGEALLGFLFFDSCEKGYFTQVQRQLLGIFAHLIGVSIVNALKPAELLKSAVGLVGSIGHLRDEETGGHVQRMSRYSRMLAVWMAARRDLPDEFAEFVFLFAPLHDIGKIAIPDAILLKRGPLDAQEYEIMKGHARLGAEIVSRLCRSFGFEEKGHVTLLRNIVLHHHECFDGSGYESGLAGEDIPLEARIVAVADVYDALTSVRPYKAAWEPDAALAWIKDHSGSRFDPDCVAALCGLRDEIEAVRRRFQAGGEDAFAAENPLVL